MHPCILAAAAVHPFILLFPPILFSLDILNLILLFYIDDINVILWEFDTLKIDLLAWPSYTYIHIELVRA